MNESIETKSGLKLHIDTSYNSFDHVPISGTVISTPSQLIYGRYPSGRVLENSMEWKTTMELKRGDIVYFEHLASIQALGRKIEPIKNPNEVMEKYIEDENDDVYVFIEYKDIHTAVRNGNIIPINGYVICEPVSADESERVESSIISLPEFARVKESRKYMKVCYIGRPNTEYIEKKFRDGNSEISPGDIIFVHRFQHVPFEQSLHRHFSMDKKYFRVQGKYIKAIYRAELEPEHSDKWNVGLKDEEAG